MSGNNGTIPERYHDLLESPVLAYVATLGPKGEPQTTPVWFGWDGEHLKFSVTRARQKLRSVSRDPRIALSIVDPENPLWYLEIRGEVERIWEAPDRGFINAMAKKYMGRDVYPWRQPGDERIVIHVVPRHTTQMGS
jgi:PPOX class probable F420-dependent enzyme